MTLSDFQPADTIENNKFRIIKGEITHLAPKEVDGKKRYGMRIDKEMPNIWFNGWGEVPGSVGDQIEFEYQEVPTENRTFYNVKKVINVMSTHRELTKQDISMIAPESKPISEMVKKQANFASYTILMAKSVELCIKRNTLSDGEIIACFGRLLYWIETYTQLNNEENVDTSKETK